MSEETRTRGKNWEWSDSFELIHLVHKEGKNWEKVLIIMHDEHRLTSTNDSQKLRTHFNTLNGKNSHLFKDYKVFIEFIYNSHFQGSKVHCFQRRTCKITQGAIGTKEEEF